jgi:Protein of unknown function (DUF3570)
VPPVPARQGAVVAVTKRKRRQPILPVWVDAQPENHHSVMLRAFCLSALALPGMVSAEGDDEAGYQYSHYEEGVRDIFSNVSTTSHGVQSNSIVKIPNQYQPINVDSEHGFARFHLSERMRFAFNYSQDVWSGASPVSTAPASMGGNNPRLVGNTIVGASPLLQKRSSANMIGGFFDAQGHPLLATQVNAATGAPIKLSSANPLQQTMGYASPEMRNQADFKLGYDWDGFSLDAGGGVSVERDYLSRFGNVAGRMDFNQKRTTLNMSVGYTNSYTHALLDPATSGHISTAAYPGQFSMVSEGLYNGLQVTGTRQDTALTVGLSQVLNKNSLLSGGFGFTNSNGYLSNAYKDTTVFLLQPHPAFSLPQGVQYASYNGISALEKRPNQRNQFTWDLSYRQFIETLNAAPKLGYNFFHDDWGVSAHTFDGEWRQSLGETWTLTPHVRYYAQTAATFYAPYLFSSSSTFADLAGRNFSSDQRLAAFGALSGGVTLSKQFIRGLNLDLGFEYYTRASALTLDGAGSGDYQNYHFYTGSATLRINLANLAHAGSEWQGDGVIDSLARVFYGGDNNNRPAAPAYQTPAGVMFANMLPQADRFAVAYRFQHQILGGGLLNGSQHVDPASPAVLNYACQMPGVHGSCAMLPNYMVANTNQLDLLYAPTDWLNLMIMPQFVDSNLNSDINAAGLARSVYHDTTRNFQDGGGIGDTGAYALFKIWGSADGQHQWHTAQGFSIPTGNISLKSGLTGNTLSFPLQAGSGTWDYRPSLTYKGHQDDWFWGGQLGGTLRMESQNKLGYALGNLLQGQLWSGYQLTSWLSASLRGVYNAQSRISGSASFTNTLSTSSLINVDYLSTADAPQNSGGDFADIGFGFSVNPPGGIFNGSRFSFEWLQPVYTRVNGYQLDRTGTLAASWNYGF